MWGNAVFLLRSACVSMSPYHSLPCWSWGWNKGYLPSQTEESIWNEWMTSHNWVQSTWKIFRSHELILLHRDQVHDQGDPIKRPNQSILKISVLGVHWKDWCWSWSSNTLALCYLVLWCEELPHWKRPWCWEGLGAEGEGDGRGWDGWMASLTWWTWVWVNSGSWWWIGRPGVLRFRGSQSRTRLNDWTELRGPGGGEEPQIPFLPSLTPSSKKFKNKQKLLSCPSPWPGRTFLGQSLGHCVTHIFLC